MTDTINQGDISQVTPQQMLRQVAADGTVLLSMYVAPHYRTPKHFHEHYTEYFEVLSGEVTFGMGEQRLVLKPGGKVSVPAGVVHSFQNATATPAVVRVSVSGEGEAFEAAFLIYHGLIRDGLVDKKLHPKSFGDLALFLQLTNSRMPGLAKYLVEPFFLRAAARAAASGRLDELKKRYVPQQQ
jgi:quercetin dioxygenase-like cupin family protein